MKYTEGHYYHIYNRGAHKKEIFFEEENYDYLISLFKKYSIKYNIVVAAYCCMPNHYHLVLKQQNYGDIGSFLKTVFNAYTQAINKRFCHSGTIFQGQAKIKEIDTDSYCLQVIRYVHLNPLTAKLVKDMEEWKYSNYLEWIGKRDGSLMDYQLRDS
ncbi:MAG: transposase [Bacteroidetes bacterium]|nr:transposase [Bacteroidota bacterium]